MDYNQAVKVVETKRRTSEGKNISRLVQVFNCSEQIIQEFLYCYDFKDGAEFLREKREFKYTVVGKIASKYEFIGHYPSDIGDWALDLEEITTFEYNTMGRVVKVNEKKINAMYVKGINEYITVFEYFDDGTSIGKHYPAQFYNDPHYHNYTTKHYDKVGHLIWEDSGVLKKVWHYDDAGNVIKESWRYGKGITFPMFKKEYDERGNVTAEFHFKGQTEEISWEVHSAFNEQNQEIQSSLIDHDDSKRNRTTTYEYEVTVHNVDPADIENGISVSTVQLPPNAQILLEKARQNDADAMAQVAANYYNGDDGFPRDDNLAFYWSEKTTTAYPDYDFAWEMLGRCYEFGVGTEKNAPKAIVALKKSVELGKTDILYHLADLIYFEGNENEKAECLPFLERAISNQSAGAEGLLGDIYLHGKFQTNDRQRGIELLTRSAEHGDPQGARLVAEAYLHQVDGCEQVVPYSTSQAAKYFAIAVENGEDSHKALYYAGPAFFYGEGVPKNMEKARKCIEALIDDAYVPGEKVFDLLGCMCFEGAGGPVDFNLGEKALQRAIKSDDTEVSLDAMSNLGMYFYTLTNRIPEAIQLLQNAANRGNASAQVNLGKAYYEGKGVPQNRETAAYYFGLAAKQGNQTAIENLQVMGTSNSVTTYNEPATQEKRRHPIRGAIIGYFVGGFLGAILHLFWPGAEWISTILGVIIGALIG